MLQLEDFLAGFLAGVVFMLIVGWVLNLNSRWIRDRDAFRSPQTVGQSTSKTPAQLYRQSVGATSKLLLLRLAALVMLWLLVELLFPEFASSVRNAVSSFFQGLFG